MTNRGTPVARSWVVMMRRGIPAVDWGAGTYLDILTNQFFVATEKDVSHRALEADLDWLKRIGRIEEYDVNNVYFTKLPNFSREETEKEE
jgi:hypothetical protein